MLHTVGDMVTQDLFLDPAQGRTCRSDLCDDVDAVSILLHHAREAPHLTFYAAQAFQTG